jgi:hypothetical protein
MVLGLITSLLTILLFITSFLVMYYNIQVIQVLPQSLLHQAPLCSSKYSILMLYVLVKRLDSCVFLDAVLPPGRPEGLQRGLPPQPGQVRHRGVGPPPVSLRAVGPFSSNPSPPAPISTSPSSAGEAMHCSSFQYYPPSLLRSSWRVHLLCIFLHDFKHSFYNIVVWRFFAKKWTPFHDQ